MQDRCASVAADDLHCDRSQEMRRVELIAAVDAACERANLVSLPSPTTPTKVRTRRYGRFASESQPDVCPQFGSSTSTRRRSIASTTRPVLDPLGRAQAHYCDTAYTSFTYTKHIEVCSRGWRDLEP